MVDASSLHCPLVVVITYIPVFTGPCLPVWTLLGGGSPKRGAQFTIQRLHLFAEHIHPRACLFLSHDWPLPCLSSDYG